jgi:hypothetical protein
VIQEHDPRQPEVIREVQRDPQFTKESPLKVLGDSPHAHPLRRKEESQRRNQLSSEPVFAVMPLPKYTSIHPFMHSFIFNKPDCRIATLHGALL